MAQDERFLSLFSGFPEEGEAPEQDTLLSLIEYIAQRLDEIELNTRIPGTFQTPSADREVQEKSVAGRRRSRDGDSIVARAGKDTSSKRKSPADPVGKNSTAVAHATASSQRGPETPQPSKAAPQNVSALPSASPKGESDSPKVVGTPSKDGRPVADSPSVAVPASPSTPSPKKSGIPVQTKSQEALAAKREEELAKSTSLSLVGALKKNLATWDGSISGEHADLEDAAGVAVAGPVWGAVQEIKEVFEKFGEDENSLLGTLKKTVADKTGISTATAWADEKKNAVRSRLVKWAGGDPAATVAAREETRDAQGRFKKKRNKALPQKPMASDAEEAQAEIAKQSLRLNVREAKNEEVRHEELISAVRGIGGDSLLDSAGDLLKLRRGNRVSIKGRGPRISSPKPGLLRRAGQALTKGGKKLTGGAMAAGGLLAGGLGLGAKEGKVASLVARPAAASSGGNLLARSGRNAAALGKGTFKLGGKALLGSARAIPVAGQILAAGLAIKDGLDGCPT